MFKKGEWVIIAHTGKLDQIVGILDDDQLSLRYWAFNLDSAYVKKATRRHLEEQMEEWNKLKNSVFEQWKDT